VRQAVFLDRDGVLNAAVVRNGRPYPPSSVEEFAIVPDAAESCERLAAAGFLLIVATNQPDIARGTQDPAVVARMNDLLCDALGLDEILVCPHDGIDDCPCRKPRPGMLLDAAARWNIDLAASFMVGDRWRDVDCGNAAGCRTVFLDFKYDEALRSQPHYTTDSLRLAADWILSHRQPA
jgi:D-glycero-D-manno-heptose 1,7-bisphosphate phosphatase